MKKAHSVRTRVQRFDPMRATHYKDYPFELNRGRNIYNYRSVPVAPPTKPPPVKTANVDPEAVDHKVQKERVDQQILPLPSVATPQEPLIDDTEFKSFDYVPEIDLEELFRFQFH
ncbi:unnamed protein product [Mycena citricolor]|uniref:Uncharacterized protein n=1 Tax=Mycena citricolor TaxID=2018698 RepID=A0AAD2K3P8_9AGAR|nr:unnamed protein product [Mycena citricolor]